MEKKIILDLNDDRRGQLFAYLFNFCFFVIKVVIYAGSKNRQPLVELDKMLGLTNFILGARLL